MQQQHLQDWAPSEFSSGFTLDSYQALENELNEIKAERISLLKKLGQLVKDSDEHKKARQELEGINREFLYRLNYNYLLSNVNEEAREKLLQSPDFKQLFDEIRNCDSFVLSIDIRRSTELMLKASKPELFEIFIVSLCEKLSEVIVKNFGIFDKFTGDGILAFFPDFYSGEDAGLMAVQSALTCHSIFEEHYKENRKCFISVLADTGLGIGIDYGSTYKVKMNSALTVIGRPVVYACRMSNAKAGDTLLNQPAYEEIFNKYSKYFNFEEITLDIKNEGPTIGYKITSNGSEYKYSEPNWDELIKEFSGKGK